VVGLDGRDVGVDQDRVDAGFFESLQSLGAYITRESKISYCY
jgi:hypothetical protein